MRGELVRVGQRRRPVYRDVHQAPGQRAASLDDGAADTGTIAIANVVLGVVPIPTTTTTSITFTPPLGQGTYLDDAVLTIGPQELNIKIGDGNLTYTEHRDYPYLLDRGWLDTVREPKEVPMDVKVDAVYEHVASRSGELVTPDGGPRRSGQRLGVGQFLARPVRAVLHRRVRGLRTAVRPDASGDYAVSDVPGRDPRDELQRGDHRVYGQVQGH